MSTRTASWVAWSLVVLALALLAGGISLALMARPFGARLPYESEADPFSVIVSLVTLLTFSVVGAIIACRRLLLIITFKLQIATKRKWTRGDSNPWPPPCEGGTILCWSLPELAKYLQIAIFFREHFAPVFRRFTRVAARLLHRGYGLHPHKVRDDRYSTSHLEITSASFVLGVFCKPRMNGVLRSSSSGRSR